MKKILCVLLMSAALAAGVAAETADYLTFTVGAGFAVDVTDTNTDTMANNVFGVDYNFNETFTGGFKYMTMSNSVSGVAFSVMNFSMMPKENVTVSLYTGSETSVGGAAFGLGLEYDFFTKKDGLFSAMGVYVDWLASSAAGVAALEDGGIIAMGLKTKVGF